MFVSTTPNPTIAPHMIKTSKHAIKFANPGKQLKLQEFLRVYNLALQFYIDYFWETRIQWGKTVMDIKRNKLDVPPFISTALLPKPYPDLSARVIGIIASEALGVIKTQTERRKKQLYVLATKMRVGDAQSIKRLQSRIDSATLMKPDRSGCATATLNINCCEFVKTDTHFDGFLKLKSIGKSFGTICIPVVFTKHTNSLISKNYRQMTTWRVSSDFVVSTCLSLSDGQSTQKCPHGHDLASILDKMARKRRGSLAAKRCQDHRKNYINYSINRLNLHNVSELRLEKLRQMRAGHRTSTALTHWTYTQINAQITSRCAELGVPVIEQSATYRSQRCSSCGWTQKSNRKRKEFVCKSCGQIHDADTNGALNHEADIYRLPFGFYKFKHNIRGFFWTASGVCDEFGRALTVPDVQNE